MESNGLDACAAEVVLRRIQGVLDQLPQAVKQAHERIIGERQVESKDRS